MSARRAGSYRILERRLPAGIRGALVASAIALVVSACSSFQEPISALQRNAPELPTDTIWLNTSEPITLKSLRGQIVLLDFESFSGISYLHVLPFIKRIEQKYPGQLQILTIHAPKFDNEREVSYLAKNVLKYDLRHPVANDLFGVIAQAYAAKVWPKFVLIDPHGKIIGEVSGDTKCDVMEQAIASLVKHCEKEGSLRKDAKISKICGHSVAGPLAFPTKLLVDEPGKRLFISDTGHNRILVCRLDGTVVQVIGTGCKRLEDGRFDSAKFDAPQGLALRDNHLYIADSGNNAIRCADLSNGTVSTLATGAKGGAVVVNKEPEDKLDYPVDLIMDESKLYVATAGTHQIWCIDIEDGTAKPIAGSGTDEIVDGRGTAAQLAEPSGMVQVGKRLYFVDGESSAVRCFNMENNQVFTLVGKALFAFGDRDGDFSNALMQHPLGIASSGQLLYVSDSFNHKIKSLDLNTRRCATICGSGTAGLQDGEFPQLSEPNGIARAGNQLYIADTNNSAIRVFNLTTGIMSTLRLHEPSR